MPRIPLQEVCKLADDTLKAIHERTSRSNDLCRSGLEMTAGAVNLLSELRSLSGFLLFVAGLVVNTILVGRLVGEVLDLATNGANFKDVVEILVRCGRCGASKTRTWLRMRTAEGLPLHLHFRFRPFLMRRSPPRLLVRFLNNRNRINPQSQTMLCPMILMLRVLFRLSTHNAEEIKALKPLTHAFTVVATQLGRVDIEKETNPGARSAFCSRADCGGC